MVSWKENLPKRQETFDSGESVFVLDHTVPRDGAFSVGRTYYGTTPESDKMIINRFVDIDDTSFHEHLHRGRIGDVARENIGNKRDQTLDFYK